MIRALVLAAGESTRMGRPKPLLRIGTTSFLGRIVDVLRQSAVAQTTVVLGAQAKLIQAGIDLTGVDVVINEAYGEGQLSSLVLGLSSLPGETDALLLCLVDCPFISVPLVDRLVAAFRTSGKPIVVPVVRGRGGHPTLFARPVFAELRDAPKDQGARYVIRRDPQRVLQLQVTDPDILVRVNTPDDYRARFGEEPRTVLDPAADQVRGD